MTKGEVIIDGSAGDGVGQGIYGGTVVVHKDVGSRTGEIMKNGTIIVGGNSGFMSGLFMMGGRIIVLGDISDDAGESIIRGTIYVGGEIKSLGKNAKIEELEEKEKIELKELLENYDFPLEESKYQKFHEIVPRSGSILWSGIRGGMKMTQTHKDQKSVALVGTPCHIIAAEKMDHYSNIIGDVPVDFKLGLFCMENFSHTYLKKFLSKNDIEMDAVKEFRVEKGQFWAYLKNGEIFKIPLSKAKTCMRKNCQVCMDYTSELADLSVGSVGSAPGWSTVIARTEKGLKTLQQAESEGYIETKPIPDSGIVLLEKLANKKEERKPGRD